MRAIVQHLALCSLASAAIGITAGADLRVTDVDGKTPVLKDVYINYSGGFGPSPGKTGIVVERGSEKTTLRGRKSNRLRKNSKGSEVWHHRLSVELADGSTENDLEMADDWAMRYGVSAILFGTTNLGKTQIDFSKIKSIVVLDTATH